MPLGAIIGGIGSVVGGLLGQKSQSDANQAPRDIASDNIAMQREFAQSGIRWKVADAKAAGIHPLYALGANTHSFAPVSVQTDSSSPMGNAISDMGQNIGRAISATKTQQERELSALQLASAKADVEGKALDNQIRASQLKNLSLSTPPMPSGNDATAFIPGQGNSPLVKIDPSKRVASQPGRPAQEAGWRPDVSYSRTDTGLAPMIPEGLSESLEDDMIGKLMWRMRNSLMPNFSGQGAPQNPLPKGYNSWSYSGSKQEWYPSKGSKSYPWSNLRNRFYGYGDLRKSYPNYKGR